MLTNNSSSSTSSNNSNNNNNTTTSSNRVPKCASESPEKTSETSEYKNTKCEPNGSTQSLNGSSKVFNGTNNYKFSNSDLYDYTNESQKVTDSNHNHNKIDEVFNDVQIEADFDGLNYKDPNNSSQTMKILNALRKNRQLCDLILQLDNDSQDIYCHQIILACNSKFFMEIFTNYELEESNISSAANDDKNTNNNSNNKDNTNLNTPDKVNQSNSNDSKLSSIQKKSLQAIMTRNHNTTQRQLVFCLSDYLKNFLKDDHHNAKINSVINHNSPYHHYNNCNNLNHHVDIVSATHDDKTKQINLNMDYEALKLCIDYMYTSKLRVPSYLLPHVYTLAYHLSFENIVNACAQHLTEHLSVDNCLSIRSFALDENLIQASTQCIEKNIEYILQLTPNFSRSHSSSLSTSTNNLSSKNGVYTSNELNNQQPSLSSSINLAHKEFNHLPRINIELVGLKPKKAKLPDNIVALTQLCMNWLIDGLVDKSDHTLNELCDNLSMLYMNNNDHTLHDCCDMDSSDTNFNDHINDYQKKHNSTNNNGSSSPVLQIQSNTPNSARLKTFKITDQELNAIGTATPIKFKVLHDNEIICTHQFSENSFITICTLTGKLVTLSVHLLQVNGNLQNGENKNETNESISLPRNESITDFSKINGNSLMESEINNSNNDPNLTAENLSRALSTHSGLDAERLPKMRLARCSHGVVSYENKLYIIGGYERSECLNLVEIYDPKTNTIEEIAPMESRRGRAATTWLASNKSIYVMGGSNGHEDLNSIESYNIEDKKWKLTRFEYELGFTNLAAVGCDSYIYLVGLKGDSAKNQSRTCCLRYEPATNTFTRLAELNYGRSQSGLVWTCSPKQTGDDAKSDFFLFVFGGYDLMRCVNSCEVYNVQEDKWTPIPNMHESRRGCGAALHKETQTIYIVGGTNGTQSLKSVEIYDIQNKKWTVGPELNIARNNVAIEFIGDILFAIGGYDGRSFLKTIEYLNINNPNDGWSMYHKHTDFEFLSQ